MKLAGNCLDELLNKSVSRADFIVEAVKKRFHELDDEGFIWLTFEKQSAALTDEEKKETYTLQIDADGDTHDLHLSWTHSNVWNLK